ncbi:MAG: glycosyltransferase family 2 protein [Acidimicrobiales bacterium]|nr:glycosyltransferase family 2 protein [Acidimicrobiales bacterium]MCB9394916.1 glycosyltransferase family 2 protein [Acidimicrobiaceae bacterium]
MIVPIFHEQDCLPEMHRRLGEVRRSAEWFDLSVVYVDDGSRDGSRDILRALACEHDWVTSVVLARNFGHQLAVTAGLDIAEGTHFAIIDGDLQDPPELLPDMLQLMLDEDAHVVYGRRRARPGETRFKRFTAVGFYRVIRRMSGLDIPLDTGDFRVMDRSAADALRGMREHNRFLRGMVPWTGFRAAPFDYDRDVRFAGDTKYPLKRMLAFAANAIFSFSVMPIRAIQALGVALFGLASAGALVSGGVAATNVSVAGLVWIAWLNTALAGLVIASVGIVGGYVHRIQDEVRGRPLYLVEETVGSTGRAAPPSPPHLQEKELQT